MFRHRTNSFLIPFSLIFCVVISTIPLPTKISAEDRPAVSPFLGAYIHIPQLLRGTTTPEQGQAAIAENLDRFVESGLRVVMPYTNTSSGAGLYPSQILSEEVSPGWSPLGTLIEEARKRDLEIYPVICVLVSGHDQPSGILEKHPEWAMRHPEGEPTGFISPAHPEARDWVVSMLAEIVETFEPDGLLLDYLRYHNRPIQLDEHSQSLFHQECEGKSLNKEDREHAEQLFRERALTTLAEQIHREIRPLKSGLRLAIYSWGPHVVQNHRVAQDWPTWVDRGYIDMVNVSGYCYPSNYGDRYLKVFEDRLQGASNLNQELEHPGEITVCLGVRTSHGAIQTLDDLRDYIQIARKLGIEGMSIFTWSYLRPHLDKSPGEKLFVVED